MKAMQRKSLVSKFAEICETLSVTYLRLVAKNDFTADGLEEWKSEQRGETKGIGAETSPHLPDPIHDS